MGCRLSRNKAKGHDLPHHRHRGELHFLDEYGQPITVQVDGRRRRSHRKRCHHTADYNAQTERHWEALRVMGLVEGEEVQGQRYASGPYYGHMPVSPDLYSTNDHAIMSPDLYPTNGYLPSMSSDLRSPNNYLPSVSYSLDHLDRLDYQGPEVLSYQPNSESCLIGCCNAEETESNNFHRRMSQLSQLSPHHKTDYSSPWRADRPLGYLPLSELDSGLGCGTDSPRLHMALSEAETDAVSSLPGHTPSSPGSSPSSESLLSSEPSDSGFHSVSTGEFRRLQRIHSNHAHRHTSPRPGHSPREQRGRWDLESIPETTPVNLSNAGQTSRCSVGNSTTTMVQFHRAERSPTLPRQRSTPLSALGCHTEPCQRRAMWLEQQQHRGGGTIDAPGRSQTMTDLSNSHRRRRASHPNMNESNLLRNTLINSHQNSQPNATNNMVGPRSRASYPSNCYHKTSHPTIERTSLNAHQNSLIHNFGTVRQGGERSREEECLSKSPGSGSSGASDWRGFQTLGNRTCNPKSSSGLLYSTLAAPPRSIRPLSSPGSRASTQRSVRNQLLRARASRLARERSEVTTDEEMRAEGEREAGEEREEGEEGRWAGKYWSRTERRRHLALSRQHRERRGGGGSGEELSGGGQGSSSQTVLELSHRKQNRLRNSKLLDDWTTVEELLTHGTRVETDGQLCPNPLLSVTTV